MDLQIYYKDWSFISCVTNANEVQLYVQSTRSSNYCPSCQTFASRIHSRYWRTLKDAPILSMSVYLHVRSRKFFCDNPDCDQRIFTERQNEWYSPYARRTNRLTSLLRYLAFTLSAEAASKLSSRYGTPLSADAFLYLIRKEETPSFAKPVVIGIDDWAMKKRLRYGSIICDLETRKPIALLESRTVKSVKEWLQQYPSIKIVTRDGSGEYAKGIQEGLPQAVQITDRWHLFHNLTRKIGQYVRREFPRFIQVPSDSPSSEQPCPSTPTKTEKLTAGEQKKWELIRRVQARFKENVRKSDLIREFSIDRKTLNKYLKMKEPLRHKRDRQHSAEPYREMIIALLRKQTTVKHIFHILQEQGYNKSFSTLRNYILKIRKQEELNKEGMAKTKLSRRRLHLYLWSRLQCLPDEEEKFQRLFEKYRQLGKLKMLLQSFQHIMDEQKTELALKEWTEEIAESGIVELQQFADYLQSDWTAVKNVLLYSWSNGPVEGHVNKLKVIKRQMYGRANFDLLSKKILYQS